MSVTGMPAKSSVKAMPGMLPEEGSGQRAENG
jgi:hypothetical protein